MLRNNKDRRLFITVWAAALWAFLFASISFYWAAGGQVGINTLGESIERLSRSPSFNVVVWLSALLKLAAGLVILTLLSQRLSLSWKKLVSVFAYGTGFLCVLYGMLNIGARILMFTGILATPASMSSTAADWHLFFWNPFWIMGGVLFLYAGYISTKTITRSRNSKL